MTLIRKIFLTLVLLAVFAIAGLWVASYVVINSESFKTEITRQIHNQTGQQVKLQGKISWIFVPQWGASFADVEFVSPPVIARNVSAKSRQVDVFLDMKSLLSGRVIIDKLIFHQLSVSLTGKVSQIKVNAAVTGDLQIDFPSQQLTIENLIIDSNGVHAMGQLRGHHILQAPEFDGQLQIAQLNLPHNLPGLLTNTLIHFHQSPNQPVSGDLSSEHLRLKHLDLEQISAKFSMDIGKIQLTDIQGKLAGGLVKGQVIIKDFTDSPRYQIDTTLSHVELSQLLRSGILQGPAEIALNLTMAGKSEKALLASTNGTVKLEAKNGILNHIDLLRQIAVVRQFLGPKPQAASAAEVTHFSELSASGKIENGLFTNNDFTLQSPDLQAKGGGTVDMNNLQIKYQVAVRAQGEISHNAFDVAIPLKIEGTLDRPKVKVDFGGLTVSTQSDSVKKLGKNVHNELKILFGH